MRIPPVGRSGADLSAPDRCKGDTLPSIGERQTYDTTTILGAWRRERAWWPCFPGDHAPLSGVSSPGRAALSPWGRLLGLRSLPGTVTRCKPALHSADSWSASASASSAWSLCALTRCSRKCLLRYLRPQVAPACFGRSSHG